MSFFLTKNDHSRSSFRYSSRRNAFAASCSLPLLAFLSTAAAGAQAMEGTAAPRLNVPWVNRNLLWIDTGHAGQDTGVQLGKNLFEKDVTAAVAAKIRTLLTARGMLVVQTPTVTDPQAAVGAVAAAGGQVAVPQTAPLQTADDRAGIANHAHPFACVLLHASDRGSGVHVMTSGIASRPETEPIPRAIPWDAAQGWWLADSRRLANQVGLAVEKNGLPAQLITASARPIDSLMCPAVAVEMAPAKGTPATNAGYQQRVAEAIAGALLAWHDRTEPPAKTGSTEGTVAPRSAPATGAPATPGVQRSAPDGQRPAPIVRRSPSSTGQLPAEQTPAPIVRRPLSGAGTGGSRPPGSQP